MEVAEQYFLNETNECHYNPKDYWDLTHVLHTALHNLSVPCPFHSPDLDENVYQIQAPSTFLVQVFRLLVSSCMIIAILALYNSIEVLGRTVFSVASCSLHWVLYLVLIAVKSITLLVFLPLAHKEENESSELDQTGFVITCILQLLATLMLFFCLEHERRFRSPDYASVDSPFSKNCSALSKRQLFLNWPRVIAILFALISLVIFLSLELYPRNVVPFHGNSEIQDCLNISNVTKKSAAFGPLVYVWLLSMFKIRMGMLAMGMCLLFIRRENFKLTAAAKVYLVFGMLFSLFEDVPNSILTVIAFHTYNFDDNKVCFGVYFNLYDLVQLMGVFSLVSFFLFIRSQYLRVEQESKWSVIDDMQRLLQVNGRRDVRSH